MPFINVEDPPALNAQYYIAYNALLKFCKDRGWLKTIPDKTPEDEILQNDLNAIRGAIDAVIDDYVILNNPTPGSGPYPPPAPPISGGDEPFAPLTINDEKGYLVMPALYTSTGKTIYSTSPNLPDTVPVLWEHFADIAAIMNSMTARKASFFCKLLVQNDIVDVDFYFPKAGSVADSHEITRNIATDRIYDDWTITYDGSPEEITSAVSFYYYYHLTPCTDASITWTLLSVDIPPEKRFQLEFDFSGPAGEILRNMATAHVDQCHMQPVCFYDDEVEISDPGFQKDTVTNDVTTTPQCSSCNGGTCANPVQNTQKAIADREVQIGEAMALSDWDVSDLYIEHKMQVFLFPNTQASDDTSSTSTANSTGSSQSSFLYGQYNCDTRIEESYSGSGTDEDGDSSSWEFDYLRRPSGALIPFFWKGGSSSSVGRPLNAQNYFMSKENQVIVVKYPADGIAHVLNSAGELAFCRRINSSISVALAGPGVSRQKLSATQYRFDSTTIGSVRLTVDARAIPLSCEIISEQLAARSVTNASELPGKTVMTPGTADITGFAVADFFPAGEAPELTGLTDCNVTDFYNALNQIKTKFVERRYSDGTVAKGLWYLEEGMLSPIELHLFQVIPDPEDATLFTEKDTHVKYSSNGRNQSIGHCLYRKFPFGERLVARYRNFGTPEQLNATYTYGTNPAQGSYGKMISSVDFNGAWEKNTYDAQGRLTKTVRPWLDSSMTASESQCDVTTYDYAAIVSTEEVFTPDWRPRTVIRKIQNYEVSRQYHLYFPTEAWDIQAGAANAAYNAASNLTTKTYRYATGDFAGRLWKTENPDGSSSVTAYALAADGKLTTTTESGFLPDHGTRSVVVTNKQGWTLSRRIYDIESGLLTGGSDYTYDGFGRVLTETTIDGDVTAKEYNCCGPRFVTAPDGSVTEYGYDAFNRVRFTSRAGVTTYPTYNAWGNEIANTVEGTQGGELTTTREYDADGQLIKTTDAAGNITTYARGLRWEESTNALGYTQKTEYYLDGQVKAISGTGVVPKTYTYGVQYGGQTYIKESVTNYEYIQTYTDFLGRQFKTQYPTGLTETTYFDAVGRPIRQESSAGKKTLTVYDEATGKVKYQVLKRTSGTTPNFTGDTVTELQDYYEETDGEVWHVSKTFRYVNGAAVEVNCSRTSRSGKKTIIIQNGALTTSNVTTYSGEGEVSLVTTNPDGSTVTTVSEDGLTQTVTHSVLGVTTYVYDQFNRNIGYDHEEGGLLHLFRNVLDLLGQVTETSETVGTASRTTTYTYDALGHKLTETTPGGVTTTYTYNAFGQVLTMSGSTYPVAYTYNAQGRMLTLTTWQDADTPETTTFAYDNYGRMTGKTYADGKGETYTYTNDYLPASKKNAKNQTISYGYNTARELSSMMGMASPSISRSFTYDQNGNLLKVMEGSSNYIYTYDSYGNLLTETVPYAATILQHTYDSLLRPSGLAYGTDYQVGYTYDGMSRLAGVTALGQSVAYSRMAGANRLTSTAFQNGETAIHTASRTYDSFNRLTGINGFGYTLNDKDQRTKLTLTDGKTWNYDYDGFSQVIGGIKKDAEETSLASHAYTYDQIGNRITATEGSAVTNYTANLLNQYTAINEEVPTYDFDGNMLTNGEWSYTWNIENRLTIAESATTKLEFAYDYLGRRTTKKVYTKNGSAWILQTTKNFVYDDYKQIAELTDNAVTMYTVWQSTSSGDFDVPLWTKHGADVQTYIVDGNKNIRQLKDATGAVVATCDYDPFGNVTSTGITTPWQFSSEYRDDETGLVYFNYRYYDPLLGRWVRRDPSEENNAINLFMSCNNNHISSYDSLGLWLGGTHKELTHAAFAGIRLVELLTIANFAIISVEELKSQLISIVTKANVNTDSSPTGNLQEYHYCSELSWTPSLARDKYKETLKFRKKSFDDLIVSETNPTKASCNEALKHLGILTHMWQDYYAHGVEKDDSWFGAKIGTIKGSPDNISSALIPVTFGALGFRGGHGGFFRLINPFSNVEPGDRAPDSATRKSQATAFTKKKLIEYLNKWIKVCRCAYADM